MFISGRLSKGSRRIARHDQLSRAPQDNGSRPARRNLDQRIIEVRRTPDVASLVKREIIHNSRGIRSRGDLFDRRPGGGIPPRVDLDAVERNEVGVGPVQVPAADLGAVGAGLERGARDQLGLGRVDHDLVGARRDVDPVDDALGAVGDQHGRRLLAPGDPGDAVQHAGLGDVDDLARCRGFRPNLNLPYRHGAGRRRCRGLETRAGYDDGVGACLGDAQETVGVRDSVHEGQLWVWGGRVPETVDGCVWSHHRDQEVSVLLADDVLEPGPRVIQLGDGLVQQIML